MARPGLDADLRIGRTIKDARQKRGLRQSEVALAMGVSIRTLRAYETGDARVPLDRRPRLAMALRLTLADLDATCLQAPDLAPDEAAWLALYHRLPSWVRALVRRWSPAPVVTVPAQESAPC